jgi:lipid A 3-O-deacylase
MPPFASPWRCLVSTSLLGLLAFNASAQASQLAARNESEARAQALQECTDERATRPPGISVRVDNDLLGGQDEGYTGGVSFTLVSQNLDDFTTDPCLPGFVRFLNGGLTWLQPSPATQRNMTFSLSQAVFTPRDNERTDLIVEDRPYAALVVGTLGYHARSGNTIESTLLRLGWVGPSARGKEVQNAVHKIFPSKRFNGWSNQLRNEPVFQLQREWARRWPDDPPRDGSGRGSDVIAHWGASLGTIATQAIAGGQWRYGVDLPDDFGSLPLWAAGDNAAPPKSSTGRTGWSGHVFAGADLRWVLYNIALDGTVFRDGHSVDRRSLVPEVSYGFMLQKGEWKFALARYHRGREFEGQQRRPVFGSFTIGRAF